MRKSTKGALAGAAAAVLLMGGFGTHAAWNDQKSLPGGDINTGILTLSSSCGNWSLTNALASTKTYTDAGLAGVLMIPGDLLSRKCTYTVHIEGTNLVKADLTLNKTAPSVEDGTDPLADFDAKALFTDASGAPITGAVQLTNNQTVDATLQVQLDSSVTGTQGQDLHGVLESLTVTATQTS